MNYIGQYMNFRAQMANVDFSNSPLQVNLEIGLIGDDNLYFDRQCKSRQFGSFQISTSDFPNC